MKRSPEEIEQTKRELETKMNAEIASVPLIDDETWQAVQHLHEQEAELNQRSMNGEVDDEEYVRQLLAIHKATPRHVKIASLAILKSLTARRSSPQEPNA